MFKRRLTSVSRWQVLHIIPTIYLTLSFYLNPSFAFSDVSYVDDIYHVKHLESLILDISNRKSRLVLHSLFLFLYEPKCEKLLQENNHFIDFPPKYVAFCGKHDYVTIPQYVPFPLTGKDSLKTKYRKELSSACAVGLFFQKGDLLNAPQVWRTEDGSLVDWVWTKVKAKVKVRKLFADNVVVQFVGVGPKLDDYVITDSRAVTFSVYVSYKLLFFDEESKNFLHGYFVTGEDLKNEVNLVKDMLYHHKSSAHDFVNMYSSQEAQVIKNITSKQAKVAEMFRHSFKQASIVTRFTESGHHVVQMDNNIHKRIYMQYFTNRKQQQERRDFLWPVLNDDAVPVTLVPLARDLKKVILKFVKSEAEKFCGTALKTVSVVGFMSFRYGHYMFPHTDIVDKSVITAVYVLKIEGIFPPQWQWRILNNRGVKEDVTLKAGQIMFLESSSFIHGFKKAFFGKKMIAVYTFFVPEDWPWYVKTVTLGSETEKFLFSGPGYKVMEPLGTLVTNINEYTRNQTVVAKTQAPVRVKDEL